MFVWFVCVWVCVWCHKTFFCFWLNWIFFSKYDMSCKKINVVSQSHCDVCVWMFSSFPSISYYFPLFSRIDLARSIISVQLIDIHRWILRAIGNENVYVCLNRKWKIDERSLHHRDGKTYFMRWTNAEKKY